MDPTGPPIKTNNSSIDVTHSLEEDSTVDGPLIPPNALDSTIKKVFQKLLTPYIALLLSLLHVVYVTLSVTLAVFCCLKTDGSACGRILGGLDAQTVIVWAKVGLWLLFLLLGRWVHIQHCKVRRQGYLSFYRNTRSLKSFPLLIHSAGNTAVLIVLSAKLSLVSTADPLFTYLLLGILGLELFVSLPCLIIYTVKVMQFNHERPAPDICQEEDSCDYSSNNHLFTMETGFRDSSSLEEVVEKQADLIEYLKQRNTLLSKRILCLTAQQIRD